MSVLCGVREGLQVLCTEGRYSGFTCSSTSVEAALHDMSRYLMRTLIEAITKETR